jgi:hypothetical protein
MVSVRLIIELKEIETVKANGFITHQEVNIIQEHLRRNVSQQNKTLLRQDTEHRNVEQNTAAEVGNLKVILWRILIGLRHGRNG